LLPVFQFDSQACPPGVVNYWGYQPVSFFAPHAAFSSRRDPSGPVDEFRDMVKALHRAGIEVILDVVYNHTAEGGADGPTQSFRGLDNRAYYLLDPAHPARYADFTGCGNTFHAYHPVARRMILDSVRYWVQEMHVDGFRFDLASVLARHSSGREMPDPPVLFDIESDPALAGTKFIAEAWDAAGLYQVGRFVGDAWREWNGRFRDDLRQFFRGDRGVAPRFADRLVGSPEVYRAKRREPEQSINFVTCHDGFTLNDLVSYSEKHNLANNDGNRDGANDNFSWNCGVEGPTDNPAIEALRNRQVKNLLATTLLSVGVPMLYMGDEVRRTQNGNNNAYCHDSEMNWFDWSLLERHGDVLRFVRTITVSRLRRPDAHERRRLTLDEVIGGDTKVAWHGTSVSQPDWADWSHTVALNIESEAAGLVFHLIFNAYDGALDFRLPATPTAAGWRRWIDTSLSSPDDAVPRDQAPAVRGDSYRVGPQSVVVLVTAFQRTLS
jgi:glycogen operon protein